MNYVFNKYNLEILSGLIFDASIDYEDLASKMGNSTMEFERRTFENVKRKKRFWVTSAHYGGKKSKLIISGIIHSRLTNIDDRFEDNHFVKAVYFASGTNRVVLLSGRELRFELAIGNEFQIELKDLSASDFGKGSSLGTHGFTQNEWVEYLKEKKHAPQQALQCSVVTPNLNDSLNKYWAYLVFKN
jgi:hypothetical protein